MSSRNAPEHPVALLAVGPGSGRKRADACFRAEGSVAVAAFIRVQPCRPDDADSDTPTWESTVGSCRSRCPRSAWGQVVRRRCSRSRRRRSARDSGGWPALSARTGRTVGGSVAGGVGRRVVVSRSRTRTRSSFTSTCRASRSAVTRLSRSKSSSLPWVPSWVSWLALRRAR